MDSNLSLFSPVPGSRLQSFFFFFLLLCSVSPFLRSLFSFIPRFKTYLMGGGGTTLSRIQWETNLYPLLSKFIFIPSCLNKNFMESIPPCSVGKQEKPSAPLALLETGGCQAPVRSAQNSSFFPPFSVYQAQRIQCLYMNMDSQHLPTCICLLSLFKKKKKYYKMAFIESQQREGFRCLGGLRGHFDNMATPLACFIVMFDGNPCSLR